LEAWLKSIGLEERYPSFRDQDITFDQVADLTDDDLRELGLTIGDRLRFRRAVAALRAKDGTVGGSAPVLETTLAERRPLTMMFVDLENSSALGERLEPEDLMEVIRHYREFAGTAITRFGGMIGRLVGDGILAYFCYPMATENDPERAVRAALEIVRGISLLATPAGTPLSVRIGIATGQVIVSDLFAGGDDVRSIIGSTPNLAARLQGFATANGIVVAEETYARIGGIFVCEDLGKREIRGFAQAHNAWRVIGQATSHATQGRLPQWLTPFYGRQPELAILTERWKRACDGEDSTVLVIGEAGIGKSRLIEQFLAAHMDGNAHVMRFAGSALDEDSALHPVIAYLRQTARLEPDAPHDVQLANLKSVLAGDEATKQAVLPVFAELAGISSADPTLRALSPESLRERILTVLVDQILLWAADKPLCVLVEDLHWLDPTSRELLGRVVGSVADRPVMILLTTRDGFEAPWTARRDTTVVRLVPLSPADVADMVQSLFTNRDIPPHVGRLIARRTDGVPLFVEEVARGLLQSHSLDDLADDVTAAPGQAIPASLRESLMARLDRSGVAKQIAQVAAVIGRTARRDMLAAVAMLPEAGLNDPLAALVNEGVLFREPVEGTEGYTFSHALLRDAAYDSLLREDRRKLHQRVARLLEAHDPQTVSHQPELLAMHLVEGNEPEAAAPHWLEAARRNLARSALTEATKLLRRGLDALQTLPASESVIAHRLTLSALLGPALIALKGPASSAAQDLYGAAYQLSEQLPEHQSQFPLYWGWWRVSRDFSIKKHRAKTLLDRAASRDDPELLLQAHHCNWATHYDAGDFARCCTHIQAGLDIYRNGDFRHHARLYGNHDALVCGLGALAQVEWMQGRLVNGLAQERASRDWAQQFDHVGTKVHALDVQLLHRSHRRDHRDVFDLAGELVRLTSEHGLTDHRAKGLIFRGWTVAVREDPAAGLRTLEDGLARQREIGTLEDFPVYTCLHAEALALVGRPDQAVEELTRERAAFVQIGLQFWLPEVLRMLAEVTLQADAASVPAAQAILEEAAALAEAQGAVMLGLRIAITMARIEARLGAHAQAAQRVVAALARIAEDDGSGELAAARALIAGWRDIGANPRGGGAGV
jgi:class 3 adenylate cyclase/predicted ATPase